MSLGVHSYLKLATVRHLQCVPLGTGAACADPLLPLLPMCGQFAKALLLG